MRAKTVAFSYTAWKNGTGRKIGGRGILCGVKKSEILISGSFFGFEFDFSCPDFQSGGVMKNMNERKAKKRHQSALYGCRKADRVS